MNRLTWCCVLSLAFVACNNSKTPEPLVRVSEVTSDTKCPAGGLVVATGKDTNANGTLDDAEVTQTQELCNGVAGKDGAAGSNGANGTNGKDGLDGGPGTSALIVSTPLPVGDVNCRAGGVKLDIGFDDGFDGGIAHDGVLQNSEIRDTRYVCNGGTPRYPGTTTAPTGPAGTAVIDTSGGSSDAGGGSGGNIYLGLDNGSLGGSVAIFATGAVDAGVVVPALSFQGGQVPVTVSADTYVDRYADLATGLDAGVSLFGIAAGDWLYTVDAGQPVEVTGLTIAAGVTVTFAGGSWSVSHDLYNQGTITSATGRIVAAPNHPPLAFYAQAFRGAVDSNITLTGVDRSGVETSGGPGGSLAIYATHAIVNEGTITTNGGQAESGGPAGSITLSVSRGALVNTGTLQALGGDSTLNYYAGNGSSIDLSGVGVSNSGALTTTGGASTTHPGQAGNISVTSSLLPLVNAGVLTARGGSCGAATGNCWGGAGNGVSLAVNGGTLTSVGPIVTDGAAGAGLGSGGYAGGVNLRVWSSTASASGIGVWAAGDLISGGRVSARGGAGAPSGGGASVTMVVDASRAPQGQQLLLYGYHDLLANGGVGGTGAGGQGGQVTIHSQPTWSTEGVAFPSGAVLIYPSISAHGGSGLPGGSAQGFIATTQTDRTFREAGEFLLLASPLVDVRGGDGGGGGGPFLAQGMWSVENRAKVLTGAGVGAAPYAAGSPGTIAIYAGASTATNAGELDASGADATGQVGASGGGSIDVAGSVVTNSGALKARGGSSTVQAGWGGTVQLTSSQGVTANTGTWDVSAGTGPNAHAGAVLIDGLVVTP